MVTLTVAFVLALVAGPGFAEPPRVDEMKDVTLIARDLDRAAHAVYRDAAASAPRRTDTARSQALKDLYDLEQRTSLYLDEVERWPNEPRRTEDEYRNLRNAHARASGSLPHLAATPRVEREMARLDRMMDELALRYDARASASSYPARDDRSYGSDVATVPAGTPIAVSTLTSLRGRDVRSGETFDARLEGDLVAHGRVIARDGDHVTGRVRYAKSSGRVDGREQLVLDLASIDIGRRSYPLHTSTVAFEAEGTKGRDAGVIGGAAAIGALLGAIADEGDGAAKGALLGGAAGTGVVLSTKGKSVHVDPGTVLHFTLEDDLRVRIPDDNDRRRRDRDHDRYDDDRYPNGDLSQRSYR